MSDHDALPLGVSGKSPASRKLQADLYAAARSGFPVFLTGEPGSGRHHAARSLHSAAGLPPESLTWVPCNAPGAGDAILKAFVQAGPDTTVFLGRVFDLAPDVQELLLNCIILGESTGTAPRMISSHPAASRAALPKDRMRRDLFDRLYVVPVHVPPLRERRADIEDFAAHALRRLSGAAGKSFRRLSPEVLEILESHSWPGNLRELESVLRGVVTLHEGDEVTPEMLPQTLREPVGDALQPSAGSASASPLDEALLRLPLADIERRVIEAVIEREGGSIPKAARALGISPSTIYRKIESWNRGGKP